MKTRLDVTVDKSLAEWVDQRVKDKKYASRSHAVTVALTELQKKEVTKL